MCHPKAEWLWPVLSDTLEHVLAVVPCETPGCQVLRVIDILNKHESSTRGFFFCL